MLRIDRRFFHAMAEISERLNSAQVNWVLTGDLAFSIQGLPYDPSSIDIQTDTEGAYLFNDLFSEERVEAVFARRDSLYRRSHFGRFKVCDVNTEVIGDMQKKIAGEWEGPPNLSALKTQIHWDGLIIPILPLSYEAQVYCKGQNFEKAETLQQYARLTLH